MELRNWIMQLVPADEQSAAAELIDDYENGSREEFYDKYPELVGGYEDMQIFLEESRDGTINLGTILVWYQMERGRLLLVGWDGEEEESFLEDYLNYRLETLNADFTVDTENFHLWAANQEWEAPEGENRLWALFQTADRQLRAHGYCLLGFDTLCEPDSIYIGVFTIRQGIALLASDMQDVAVCAAEDL